MPNKTSSCEFSAFKRHNTVEHDANSLLEGFKKCYSTLADSLKHPINTLLTPSLNIINMWSRVIILIWHLFLKIQFYLKSTQASKAAGLDSLSGSSLKGGTKVLAKPVNDLCNLSINSEKFPDLCKVAKRKPLYKKGYLNQTCNYKPLQLHIDLWNPF